MHGVGMDGMIMSHSIRRLESFAFGHIGIRRREEEYRRDRRASQVLVSYCARRHDAHSLHES